MQLPCLNALHKDVWWAFTWELQNWSINRPPKVDLHRGTLEMPTLSNLCEGNWPLKLDCGLDQNVETWDWAPSSQENQHREGQETYCFHILRYSATQTPVDLAKGKGTVVRVREESKNQSLLRKRTCNLCSPLQIELKHDEGQWTNFSYEMGRRPHLDYPFKFSLCHFLTFSYRQDTIPKPSNQIHGP
jgi:hypothetical protein